MRLSKVTSLVPWHKSGGNKTSQLGKSRSFVFTAIHLLGYRDDKGTFTFSDGQVTHLEQGK